MFKSADVHPLTIKRKLRTKMNGKLPGGFVVKLCTAIATS